MTGVDSQINIHISYLIDGPPHRQLLLTSLVAHFPMLGLLLPYGS